MEIRKLYHMELPGEIFLGSGLLENLPDLLIERSFKRPLFVVGPYTSRFVSGEKVLVKSPSLEELNEIPVEGDVIVGVGGGKNLDSAKYLSKKTGLPYVLVPTLPSSDGIASPSISLMTGEGRISLLHRPPRLIVMDFEVLFRAPHRYILAGYGDVVSKYSSLYDWWLGHRRTGEYFGHLTSKLLVFAVRHVTSFRRVLLRPEGVHVLLESLILSGGSIGIQGSSRPASGSEHLISHAVDIIRIRSGERPLLHGLQVGLFTVFTSYLQGRNWRWVRRILGEAGHPTTLRDLGIDEDVFANAVAMAPTLRKRYTILNEVELDRSKIKQVLQEVGMV